MKFFDIVKQDKLKKRMNWINNPVIGNIFENSSITLYYGTVKQNLNIILEHGIYAGDDGYVLCAIEPNTALAHAAMRTNLNENRNFKSIPFNSRIVFVIEYSNGINNNMIIKENKIEYDKWGKSDVEYYALQEINIPTRIPSERIKGYMIRK